MRWKGLGLNPAVQPYSSTCKISAAGTASDPTNNKTQLGNEHFWRDRQREKFRGLTNLALSSADPRIRIDPEMVTGSEIVCTNRMGWSPEQTAASEELLDETPELTGVTLGLAR
ncbi:hypothetical protein AXG93_1543s1220 [Marchantia polymorpha subsp. ruderalis]|uniref:Uncharacterized protein n=1 Tax=Marchantia polymorpha subsp. ruderalis TaxID=1480154 RepID=A0A176VZ61_MARPO|nr:hypothetical protein AXG93_1543s1220 [Marchantia polymorpha subsp. ruderalis]